ncbi:lysozyme inhibitor LprI family protein [Aliikangiella sp. IMCC44359]|uniref:lysozyme inhibitor LprI family protein n=1 Tax=Aliikangiella sp. IMCC44359 TaxID=3459125 RepID=UPI00403AEA42
MIKIYSITGLLLFSQMSYGLPLWCKKASLSVEKLICSDNELAKLDDKLNKIYSGLRFELIGDKKHSLVQVEQRAWLEKRNNKICDKNCLILMYQTRIDELAPLFAELKKTSCDRPKTTNHLSDCEWNKLKRTNLRLETVFQNYLEKVESYGTKYSSTYIVLPDFIAAKKETFTAWKKFRDKKCYEVVAGSTAANGSSVINKNVCLSYLNQQRIKYYTEIDIGKELKR